MPINFDTALGSHEQALMIHSRRLKIHAANLANADTPNYKARDIDFKAALKAMQQDGGSSSLRVTHPSHMQAMGSASSLPGGELLYRVPNQASLDGNTVDEQMEQTAFAETAVRYRSTLQFLSGRFKGMMGALRGE